MARSTRLVILNNHIYLMESVSLPSTGYILSIESSLPYFSTSNGYKNGKKFANFFLFI